MKTVEICNCHLSTLMSDRYYVKLWCFSGWLYLLNAFVSKRGGEALVKHILYMMSGLLN